MSRPWSINPTSYDACMKDLFPRWLRERGGVVVYQNQMFDSSSFGDTTFLPKRYLSTDNQIHEASEQYYPDSIGLPSLRQQKVDHVTLEEFGGDVEKALSCFAKGQEQSQTTTKRKR